MLFLLLLSGCASQDPGRIALAKRLTNGADTNLSANKRALYVACGTKSLSRVPRARMYAALAARDDSGIWDELGSDALDDYVRTCRVALTKAGLPLPDHVVRDRTQYTLVTGDALRQLLPGHAIFDPDCRSTAKCTDMFDADGHSFIESGDRVPLMMGSYVIEQDRYCMTRDKRRWCKALYRTADDDYAELLIDERSSALTPVKIVDHPGR